MVEFEIVDACDLYQRNKLEKALSWESSIWVLITHLLTFTSSIKKQKLGLCLIVHVSIVLQTTWREIIVSLRSMYVYRIFRLGQFWSHMTFDLQGRLSIQWDHLCVKVKFITTAFSQFLLGSATLANIHTHRFCGLSNYKPNVKTVHSKYSFVFCTIFKAECVNGYVN